ncbi:hypothetical protein SAMN05443428_1173 [Caloramator quimbayensis]|uniref:Uncharacterized protein n=1 Tax=Caloramator quimbayensis TaxID=1147123 RepID=A0A1T4Y0F8_9CLOT|nr:hypothetical protein [Caloramator quimbayensis]SKA94958.1 hypothetical protein SAMN05443428_1173 [Caloramator quimbayensis]
MYGLSKSILKAIAAVGTLIVIGAAVLVALNNQKNTNNNSHQNTKTKIQNENSESLNSSSSDKNNGSLSDSDMPLDPNMPNTYYKTIVSIFETNQFEANAQVSSSGIIDSFLISNDILIYDNKTEKCYILARSLTYKGKGAVNVKHLGGSFDQVKNYDATGELIELYGDLITEKDNVPQYDKLPVRLNVKESLIFTLPPTKSQDWVSNIIGRDVSDGPPLVFPPESLANAQIALIPDSKNIEVSRTYSSSETVVDEVTGNLVKPNGKFRIELRKLTDVEAMSEIANLNSKLLENKKIDFTTDFIPDPESQIDENKDISVDTLNGLPLPKDYPQDIFPISEDAFIAISNTVPTEDNKNGYEVTIKLKESKEEVLKKYKTLLKDASTFTMNGVSTMQGEKKGYEYNVMIMDNTLGGKEKTMIQIILTPIDD